MAPVKNPPSVPPVPPVPLRRDPAAQVVALPGGRLLIRHRRGARVVSGLALDDLRAVLQAVDGHGDAAAVAAALEADYQPADVPPLLKRLRGDLLVAPPSPVAGRVVVAGTGAGTRRVADALAAALAIEVETLAIASFAGCGAAFEARRRRGWLAAAEPPESAGETVSGALRAVTVGSLADRLRGAELVVAVPEAVPYRAVFALQAAALAAGVPSLFLTVDPDGVRVGPATVPGAGPCQACARLAPLGDLGISTPRLLAAWARFACGRLAPAALAAAAVSAAADLARGLLAGDAAPAGGAVHLDLDGVLHRRRAVRLAGCPLCRDAVAATPSARRLGARLAADRLWAADRVPSPVAVAAPDGDTVRTVGILGGGTAGLLAALALRRKLPRLAVTLIASSKLPIIGVGEATTPLMPQFLHADLGLDVEELMAAVAPTLKLGIRFDWGLPEGPGFHYPFGPMRLLEPAVYDGGDLIGCSLASWMMAAGTVPIPAAEGDGPPRFDVDLAYHLDNRRLVAYLEAQAASRGVRRLDATIAEVALDAAGENVTALIADDGRRLVFDLYLDCSGFRSRLLGQALATPFVSFQDSLPTDAAVVAAVPRAAGEPLAPYTAALTMDHGWCWSVPQRDADHRGYVFASACVTPERAEAEMRARFPAMEAARLVRFRCGRHQRFWRGNVVALGNAYGFVEPLESTALHMLIRQIGMLVGAFPLRRGEDGVARLLDRTVAEQWDYLRWFLALHYRFNRRRDTPFWRACRHQVDVDRHAELIALFQQRGPLSCDPSARARFSYPDPLWGPEGIDLLLLGQGVATRLPPPALGRGAWRARRRRARRAAAGLMPHARALDALARRGDLRAALAAPFLAVGPAFPGAERTLGGDRP